MLGLRPSDMERLSVVALGDKTCGDIETGLYVESRSAELIAYELSATGYGDGRKSGVLL